MPQSSPPATPELPDPAVLFDVPFAKSSAPFAGATAPIRYWPVRTADPRGRELAFQDIHGHQNGTPSRSFFANRDNGARHHVAIDLWGHVGDSIVAAEDGEIVHFYPFYNGVYALIVQCDSDLVINYGEVAADSLSRLDLRKGSRVRAGQEIAFVGRSDTGSMMCHFETYVTGTISNQRWMNSQPAPRALLNPTAYLVELARTGR